MTTLQKTYPSKRETFCNGIASLQKCLQCGYTKECLFLREQLEFYKYLGIHELEKVFSPLDLTVELRIPSKIEIKNPKKYVDSTWNYERANTKTYTHCFHNYPAMMIPQVAGRLLDTFAKKDDIVLDPFCGSGSVLVEAKMRGLKSYGIDINPLALLIAKVKTTLIKPEVLKETLQKIVKDFEKTKNQDVKSPQFFNIDFWFKPETIIQLAKLKKCLDKINISDLQDFFRVVFSETVRDVSTTRKGEFKLYRIPEKDLEEYDPNVISHFIEKAERNIRGMEDFIRNCKGVNISTILLNEDTRLKTSIPEKSINIIVTSPPYGDSKTTVAYGQFSRLSLQWLGFNGDFLSIDAKSLGGGEPLSLNHYGFYSKMLRDVILTIATKDKKRAKEVLNFFLDLKSCLSELDRVTGPSVYLCIVIGNRTVKGLQLPTDEIIKEEGTGLRWNYLETIIRTIPSKRIPLKSSPSNIKGETVSTMCNESIVIFQKRRK